MIILDSTEIIKKLKQNRGECIDENGVPCRVFDYGILIVEHGNSDAEWIVVPLKHCIHSVKQVYIMNNQLRIRDLKFLVEIPKCESLFEAISQYNRTPGHIGTFLNSFSLD